MTLIHGAVEKLAVRNIEDVTGLMAYHLQAIELTELHHESRHFTLIFN